MQSGINWQILSFHDLEADCRCQTRWQAATGALLMYAHAMNLRRLWRLYGPAAVLASPGFGWTAPLAAALLVVAWATAAAAPAADGAAAAVTPDGKAALLATAQANSGRLVAKAAGGDGTLHVNGNGDGLPAKAKRC